MRKIEIDFEDRFINELKFWCKNNSININTFISNAVKEKYLILKYGDLNDILNKDDSEKYKLEDKIITKKNENNRPKIKNNDATIKVDTNDSLGKNIIEDSNIENNTNKLKLDINNDNNEEENKKEIKPKRRQLIAK